ncbi:unnamed protein product, partial [Closterium sp. NIES-54]
RAAPHSSEFPPTEAPLQTLHMDVWGPARVRGQGHERYFLLVVDDYSRYTTVFPLRSKGEVTEVLIDWIRVARLQLRERFGSDFPVLRLHSYKGGEFSSDLLRAFCHTFTLQASPQQNGIAELRIGMVMDVARTSMIHAAAPHFLWPFAVQYAAHQINLQPRISLPETSPTLRWTGNVGDASAFHVWGSRAFVRDLSADKLSFRAVPCVFLGFPPDAPGWQFYYPTSRRLLSSQDVTFDESVPYYRLFPYRTNPLPSPPLFLAPGPPLVDPLTPQVPAPSGLSQVDAIEPVEVAVDYGASGGAEPERAEPGGAGSGGAELERAEPGVAASGGPSGALSRRELPFPQELREWFARRWSRAAGVGGAADAGGSAAAGGTGAGGAAGTGAGGSPSVGGARATGPGGARTGGTGAAGPGGAPGAGATGGFGAGGAAGVGATGGTGAGAAVSAGGPAGAGAAGGTGAGGAAGVGADAGGTGVVPAGSRGAARPRPYFVPLLEQLASPLPAPSPYAGPTGGLAERREPESRPASPVCTARTSRCVPRQRPPAGLDYFHTFSPTPKMTTLPVLLHVAAQRDYELHSLDFSTAFLQGSLHEEIWLLRPPGFTGLFPLGTQWSLRLPVYGLRQAPREWHDTLSTTLAALGFAPSTADPSLFLRTDTSLPPFYILVYVDDLVFATADTAGLAHVKSELQKRHTWTDLGELRSYLGLQITRDRARRTITLTQSHMGQQVLQRFDFTYSSPQATPLSTRHSLSALPSDESVELSGPYPELVGYLMYLMTCTRLDLAYPLSILARYVAPRRHRLEHMAAAKRVLRYLCSTSSMGLVLGGRSPVVLTGHADASWVDDLATQRSSQGYTFSLGSGSVSWQSTCSSSVLSSSCEAEIYAGAMAAQELRWLTYLLTDLGEPPRSPPVLYVDNKAMLALCREHRLEHRTKHIALRYFLARELQQCGQLRLAYVASQANTADIFTKALQPCDHQRFCTMLGLVPTWPHLLTS